VRLIPKENSSKLNEEHFIQTHGIALGTKMALAFSVIFMADFEKRLLVASPLKPFVWERFIDDIFSLGNIPMEENSIFVNLANSFDPTTRFTCEMSSNELAFHLLEFSIRKPISSPLKLFSIHTSLPATHLIRKFY